VCQFQKKVDGSKKLNALGSDAIKGRRLNDIGLQITKYQKKSKNIYVAAWLLSQRQK
jgi:hypothetical protein